MGQVDFERFTQTVATVDRIGLDTSILIYHLGNIPPYTPFTSHLLTMAAAGTVDLVISTITVAEVLVGPAKAGRQMHWIQAALVALPLVIADVTWDVARRAAELRGRVGLNLPDALILAGLMAQNAELVVTNDAAWRKRKLPVRLAILGDYLDS